MGWAARVNKIKHGPINIKKYGEYERNIKVHIPNSDLPLADALFMGMLKGLRPMTPDERAEARMQGMDMRPPDVVKREREFGLQKENPEVKIILTD